MSECFGNKFILNGELLPSDLFDNALVLEGDSVYEVIRMVKGNPVFFHDHIERLSSSVKFLGKEMLADLNDLRSAIISLTDSDRKKETNLKIVFNYNGVARNFLVYNIEPSYPSAEQYKNGVKGILFHAERKDPQSKVINHRLRSEIYHRLILEGAYEAILVNQKNMITEGSRSNIFFLKDNTLITAPENVILSGITRKHIIEICRMENISIGFRCVNADEISDYESVFMTGTSPMLLPFCCIGAKFFNVQLALMDRIRELYRKRAEESINRFRSE
ncbi:MAG: aminotransferase class IV [Bacteroidales bacterium]|nr:aminotransferase class IV [Bacteroidales bacterium]